MKRGNSKRKKLTKLIGIVAVVCAVVLGVSFVFAKKSSNDVVVAKINKEKIYKSDIERKLRSVYATLGNEVEEIKVENLSTEIIEAFAKEIYLEKELVAKAKKAGVTKKENVKNDIKEAKNKIITNAYFKTIIDEKVNDKTISDKYAELTNNLAGKKEVLISHIVVKDKAQAEKIYTELTKKRANFSALAKKNSIDKETANKGGSLGYILEDNVVKEIAQVIPTLKKGEYSKPIETKFGWHIIKVDGTKDAKVAPFESVKENIKEQMIREATSSVIKDIFANSEVEVLLEKDNKENKTEEQKTSDNSSTEAAGEVASGDSSKADLYAKDDSAAELEIKKEDTVKAKKDEKKHSPSKK